MVASFIVHALFSLKVVKEAIPSCVKDKKKRKTQNRQVLSVWE